jgi:hypothetical protein
LVAANSELTRRVAARVPDVYGVQNFVSRYGYGQARCCTGCNCQQGGGGG